jgi:hypothetical protein
MTREKIRFFWANRNSGCMCCIEKSPPSRSNLYASHHVWGVEVTGVLFFVCVVFIDRMRLPPASV